jgi:hypothetical protein
MDGFRPKITDARYRIQTPRGVECCFTFPKHFPYGRPAGSLYDQSAMSTPRRFLAVSCAALIGALAWAAEPIKPEHRVITLSPKETQAATVFTERVKEYLVLHRKMEASLPKLPKEATPEQLDKNQRGLWSLISAERADAKPGEFFTPAMQGLVRRTMKAVLGGPDGKTIRASIMDENPGVPNLKVNDRYPDTVPLSTMPPPVLEPLPKLEEDLEYRFVGERLVLVDAHAHLIVDFTEDVLP